jgi:hypothetical protein
MRAAMESQPRIPHNTIPDLVDDEGAADVDALLQTTENTNPRWSLPEIDVEIDVEDTFE